MHHALVENLMTTEPRVIFNHGADTYIPGKVKLDHLVLDCFARNDGK
ncbi:MAG: hypothetical protein LBF54_04160 [Holosporaceae bacterium]|nr:hypothetical protein [Holosporaceae bacterium]